MEQHNLNESLACLNTLRDPLADAAERERAFTRMMWLVNGWWGRGSLTDFVTAMAKGFAHHKLAPHGIAVDRVDYEELANQSLMILFRDAKDIRESPRNWLVGIIRNLIRSEIRASWAYLTSAEPPDELAAPDEMLSADEEASLAIDDKVIDAIRRLPPALRVVAELHYIHQVKREELAEYLELSDATLRKRIQRAREALQEELTAYRMGRRMQRP